MLKKKMALVASCINEQVPKPPLHVPVPNPYKYWVFTVFNNLDWHQYRTVIS